MLVTTQWSLKRAVHLTSLVWVCVLWLPWKLNGAICAMSADEWFSRFILSHLNRIVWAIWMECKYGFDVMVYHYCDIIMGTMASQITSSTIVYSNFYSGADQKKKSKLCITGLCVWNSPVTGEFPAQMASNAENVSIWWCHDAMIQAVFQYEWHAMGLLPDTQNCGLRMRRECRERFPPTPNSKENAG